LKKEFRSKNKNEEKARGSTAVVLYRKKTPVLGKKTSPVKSLEVGVAATHQGKTLLGGGKYNGESPESATWGPVRTLKSKKKCAH